VVGRTSRGFPQYQYSQSLLPLSSVTTDCETDCKSETWISAVQWYQGTPSFEFGQFPLTVKHGTGRYLTDKPYRYQWNTNVVVFSGRIWTVATCPIFQNFTVLLGTARSNLRACQGNVTGIQPVVVHSVAFVTVNQNTTPFKRQKTTIFPKYNQSFIWHCVISIVMEIKLCLLLSCSSTPR